MQERKEIDKIPIEEAMKLLRSVLTWSRKKLN